MKTLHTIYTSFAKRLAIILTLLLTLGVTSVWGAVYTYDCTSNKNFYTNAELTTNPSTGNSNTFAENASFYAADGACFTVLRASKVYFNSGYLMVGNYQPVLQLPTYANEKITKVKFWNSSGCSTSVKVAIKSGSNTAAAQQIWSNQGSSYTYNISETYQSSTLKLDVTSNNAQITKIEITTSASCANSIAVSAGTKTNVNSISFSPNSIATCSSTAADRQVTITVTPNTGYEMTSGSRLTFTKTSGTATANYVSGPTASGSSYQFVYRFNQNDNGVGTFSASCTAKKTTISFDQNGGEGGQTAPVTATYGQNMPTPITLPTRYGHTFGGYYEGVGGTGTQYYTAEGASARTWDKTSSSAILYAQWTEKLTNYRTTCTTQTSVSFDLNGGSGTFGTFETEPLDGDSYTIPETEPTRNGYNFAGWKIQDGDNTVYKYGTTNSTINNITESITLVAQWSAIEYTITYHLNGGSGVSNTTYTIESGNITLPTPTPAQQGLIFAGWYESADFTGNPVTVIAKGSTGNKVFYAKWEKSTPTFAWSAASYTAALEADNTFPTLNNPNGLSVTYTSSNNGVATIDEDGNITLVATGITTITATGAETATHKSATANYTLNVAAANCKWVETNTIEDGDEVVITMKGTNGVTYTFENTKNTTSAPSVVEVNNISGTYITNVVDRYKWVVNKDGDDLTFKSYSSNDYLYCINKNGDGVRVGNTSSSKIFIIDNESGYLKHTVTNRYIGVYNNQDWRCYTDKDNFAGQTLKFYKKVCLDSENYWVEGNLTNVTCSPQLPQQLAKDGSITLTFTAADGYALPNTVTVTNATNTWDKTNGKLTISNPTGNVMVTVSAVELHTITWMVGSNSVLTEEVANATGVTQTPDDPANGAIGECANAFMGWTETSLGSAEGQSAPADLCTAAQMKANNTSVTGDKTFYAVFADVEGGETTYEKVTTISEGTYLMATTTADKYKTKSTLAYTGKTVDNENRGGVVEVTISDGVIGVKPESAKEITVTLGTEDDANYFAMFDGEYYITQTVKNKFTFASEVSYEWSLNANGQIKQKSVYDGKDDIRIYMNNGNSGSQTEYFCPYAAKSEGDNNGTYYYHAYLFKKIGGMSYSNYVTSCCETPAPTNGTYDNVTGSGNTMSLTLNWEGSASRYHITGGNLAAEGVYTSETSYPVNNLTECEEYIFNVTAYPAEGCESAAIQISAQPFSGAKTVTFVYGNEQPNTTFTTDCDNQSTALPTPTRSGYRFLGWFTEESGGTEITENPYTPTTDITLHAQWVQVFTVTYDPNNATSGTVPTDANSPYDINKIVTVQGNTGNLQRLGYNFVGWNTAIDASGTQYSAGQTFTITENTTLYAQWIENYCTLTFTIPSGGGQAVSAPEQVLNGYSITFPEVTNISSEYWCETFIGWTTEEPNGEGLWDGTPTIYESGTNSEAITANTTFYAVYQRSGGGASGTVDLKCEDVSTWKSNVLGSNNNSYGTPTTRTATDGSVWTTNGQIVDAGDINLKEEYYLKLPELPGSITTIRMKVSQGNCTEACSDYAGNETEYKVNFKSTTDGNVLFSSETTKSRSRTIEITDGTYYTGYLYCSSGTLNVHAVSVDYGPAPIISHSLQCGCAIDEFNLTYDANETNFPNSTTNCEGVTGYKFSEHEDKYTICSSVPTLDGYKFIGWTTNANGSGDLYTSGQEIKCVPSSDITLYAQYERVYTVIFDNQNTINTTTQTRSGAAVDVPTATEPCGSEWQFVGWSTEEIAPMSLKPTITIEPGINTYIPEGNVTLYAIYQKTSLSKEFVAGKTGAYKISNGSDLYASTFYSSYLQSVNNLADATTYYITYTASDDGKYTIQQADGQYIAYSGNGTSLKQSKEPYYWKITKDGELWQVATIPAERYLKYSTEFRAYESKGNIGLIATEGQYYYRTMSCDDNFDITFNNQNGAIIHWQNGYPQAAYQDLEGGTTITTFPTASYEGWTFIGWRAQEYEESTSAPESSSVYGGLDGISGNALTITANVTMYPVFTQFLDNDPFDEVNGGDYYMYYIADENLDDPSLDEYGATNRIYAGEYNDYSFRSTQSCADATLFTFAKLPNGKWTIYDNTRDKFVYGVNNDNKLEDKAQTADGKIKYVKEWTIEVNKGNQVNAVSVDGYILSAFTQDAKSGTFKNYDDDNLTNGNGNQYHRVYLGTCTERVFTTAPSTVPIITLNGDVKVTSTATQSVKAASVLTVSASNIATSNLSITSDNAAFIVSPTTITVVDKKVGVTPITITYKPTITSDGTETATITVSDGNEASESITVTGRHLSENFVIATKVGATWYALPANMNGATNPEGVVIDVDETTMTATAPNTTVYTLFPVKTTNTQYDRFADFGDRVRFSAVNNESKGLWATSNGNTINNGAQIASESDGGTIDNTNPSYEWKITTTIVNGNWQYTLQTDQPNNQKYLRYWTAASGGAKWGTYASGNDKLYFLPVTETKPFDYKVVEWYPTKVLIQTDAAITNPIVKIGGILVNNVTCTNKGGKLYEISGLPLVNNPTKVLTLSYTADEVTYTNSKVVPIILSRETMTISAGELFASLTKEVYNYADLVVRDGATLTMDGTQDANTLWDVTIYPTSKISVPESKKLTVHSLTFFGGIDDIYDGSTYTTNKYGVPELSLKGSLKKSISTIDYLMRVNLDQMYSLSVPYDVQLAGIKYWDGSDIALGTALYISAYDGAARANQSKKTWIYETDFESRLGAATLKAGVGYTISAELQAGVGSEYSILRLPMTSNVENDATEAAKTVAVTAWGIDANITDNHKGWNLVGNPYMTTIQGADDDDLVLGKLQETGTGPWEWVEKTYRYVTIPSDDGTYYWQKKFTDAVLPPFKNFFVQVGTTGELVFDLGTRKNMRAHHSESSVERDVEFEILMSNATRQDNTGLLISEGYSPAYEINADLEKMTGSMSVYTIFGGYKLAYNALSPINASEWIPIGYIAPAAGEYTFSLDDVETIAEQVEHVYIIDYNANNIVDLMDEEYKFTTDKEQNDNRFAINVVLSQDKDNTTTGLDMIQGNNAAPIKFIHQDKMYIYNEGIIYDATGKQVTNINK